MTKNVTLNVRNVVKVGFINNFNPRKSYPEFGRITQPVKQAVTAPKVVMIDKPKQINKALIRAKKDPKNKHSKKWTVLAKSSVI